MQTLYYKKGAYCSVADDIPESESRIVKDYVDYVMTAVKYV